MLRIIHLDRRDQTTRGGTTAAAADPLLLFSGRGDLIRFAMPLVARSRGREKINYRMPNGYHHIIIIVVVRSNYAAASGILLLPSPSK